MPPIAKLLWPLLLSSSSSSSSSSSLSYYGHTLKTEGNTLDENTIVGTTLVTRRRGRTRRTSRKTKRQTSIDSTVPSYQLPTPTPPT